MKKLVILTMLFFCVVAQTNYDDVELEKEMLQEKIRKIRSSASNSGPVSYKSANKQVDRVRQKIRDLERNPDVYFAEKAERMERRRNRRYNNQNNSKSFQYVIDPNTGQMLPVQQ